jgi:heme-degrading monooxygenase HmoA
MRRLSVITSIATVIVLVACATQQAAARRAAEPAGTVARIWHGRTPDARAAAYYDYLMREGISKLEKIPHNQGVDVLTRSRDGVTEFTVISYWRSLDDIKAYAGNDIEKTHNLPRDAEMLLELEPNVRHFEVRYSVRQ